MHADGRLRLASGARPRRIEAASIAKTRTSAISASSSASTAASSKSGRPSARSLHRRHPEDLLVLYYSGHGLKDDWGHLHSPRATRRRSSSARPRSTRHGSAARSISAPAKRIVLILDCCAQRRVRELRQERAGQRRHRRDVHGRRLWSRRDLRRDVGSAGMAGRPAREGALAVDLHTTPRRGPVDRHSRSGPRTDTWMSTSSASTCKRASRPREAGKPRRCGRRSIEGGCASRRPRSGPRSRRRAGTPRSPTSSSCATGLSQVGGSCSNLGSSG